MRLEDHTALQHLVRQRLRVTGILTVCMLTGYFGFLGLVAFGKSWMTWPVLPHLPLGLLLGLGTIVFTWLLTGIYVRWANRIYDPQLQTLKQELTPLS